MRHGWLLFAILVSAGCTGQKEDPVPPPPPESKLAEVANPTVPWHVALPGNVDFDVAAHLRGNSVYVTRSGATRQKVTFELLDATPDRAEATVDGAMQGAGYEPSKRKVGKGGRVTVRYRKSGSANIVATFYPTIAKKPAHPRAKSMVAFSWQTAAGDRSLQPQSSG